jgi:hypothetical protein
MKRATAVKTVILWVTLATTTLANTYGSVEPIATSAVIDTDPLKAQSLDVRQAFAERVLQCGVVADVVAVLSSSGSIRTINGLNTRLEVGAGGFAGATNPSYVFTVIDGGPNAATHDDVRVLTDGLGYVLSQASAFLLDADDATRFDFPAQYVVLNFRSPPPLGKSAALFEAVGQIDPELFETDSSGYTQYGRAYLSLQSFVPDDQFINGYVRAAAKFGLEYTPVIAGAPGLFVGGAAFPGNDWIVHPNGEEYLARIPARAHRALAKLRASHLRFTRDALRQIAQDDEERKTRGRQNLSQRMSQLPCR